MVVDTRWPGATRYELQPVGQVAVEAAATQIAGPHFRHALDLVVMRVVTSPRTLSNFPWELAANPTCLPLVKSQSRNFEHDTAHT